MLTQFACALARVAQRDVVDSYTGEVYYCGDTLALTPGGELELRRGVTRF